MSCRSCGSKTLEEVLDMGKMPLAGDFRQEAKRYPLAVDHCVDCDVLQVRELVPHEVIFSKNYCYASSTVPALVTHFSALALEIQRLLIAVKDPFVLEIGANDGILLKALDKLKMQNVGVDASANVVAKAQKEGCAADVLRFSSETASKALRFCPAGFDLVTFSNVFAHNHDPNDFLKGVKYVLKPGGYVIIEVHDADAILKDLQWDCFYHEHCFNWTVASLVEILQRHGFSELAVSKNQMHGGALRVCGKLTNLSIDLVKPNFNPKRWEGFSLKAKRSARVLHEVVKALHRENINLIGAAGRAAILVNYAELAPYVSHAFDGSPLRIGKHIPGTAIKIKDEKEIKALKGPQIFLLGAWHLEPQLVEKVRKLRSTGIFITPLPCAKVF